MESPMGTGQSSPNLRRKEQDSQPPQEQDHRPEQQLLAMQPDLSKTSSTNLGTENSGTENETQHRSTDTQQLEEQDELPELYDSDLEGEELETTHEDDYSFSSSDDNEYPTHNEKGHFYMFPKNHDNQDEQTT